MYGYAVAWRRRPNRKEKDPAKLPTWTLEQCDEYRHLPAHYLQIEEALDRAAFLRKKGVDARVLALIAEPTDTTNQFEREKVRRPLPE
jgi:hypothetical protein